MTKCLECNDTGERDSGGTHPWGEPVFLPCNCKDAEIGRQWRENSSLEKWFPVTAERLAALERENLHLAREARTWWEAAQTYAKQAQRTPLDPIDIEEMWDEVTGSNVDEWHQEFARRIERRHGIGGDRG